MIRDPLKSGRGRHRSQDKSEEDIRHEMAAKGHTEKPEKQQPEEPSDELKRKDRGNQKGFGKNQGKEASDMTTDRGTRGAEHG